MTYTRDEAAMVMSMKADTITSVVEVVDGTLVTTREGAQTLIRDGRCSPVLPRRPVLNLAGRGSVGRHVPEPGPDLTPLPPADGTERVSEGTGAPMEGVECVPDGTEHELTDEGADVADAVPGTVPGGTAADVMAWVGEDKDRAGRALDAEMKRDKPRVTLVNTLSQLLAKLGYES